MIKLNIVTVSREIEPAHNYFHDRIRAKVLVVLNGKMRDYFSIPAQGWCYYLSAWAVMGLDSDDLRVVGTIDETPTYGRKHPNDYKHAWVEFQFGGEWYVYDSSKRRVCLRDDYYDRYHPRKITSKLTQNKILRMFLKSEHVYIGKEGYDYVFKDLSVEEDKKQTEDDGYLLDALSRGHLYVGTFPGRPKDIKEYTTRTFIACRR